MWDDMPHLEFEGGVMESGRCPGNQLRPLEFGDQKVLRNQLMSHEFGTQGKFSEVDYNEQLYELSRPRGRGYIPHTVDSDTRLGLQPMLGITRSRYRVCDFPECRQRAGLSLPCDKKNGSGFRPIWFPHLQDQWLLQSDPVLLGLLGHWCLL